MAQALDADFVDAKNTLHQAEAFVYLLEVQRRVTGTTLRYAFHDADIVYDGNTYTAIAGEVSDISHESGSLEECKVTVSNVDRVAQRLFEDEELQGQQVTLRLVHTGSLDNTSHHDTLEYEVLEAVASEQSLTVSLGAPHLAQHVFPLERFLPDRCPFTFKGSACGYTGAETTCDKAYGTSTGCLGRSNQARYGGFPHTLHGNDPLLG